MPVSLLWHSDQDRNEVRWIQGASQKSFPMETEGRDKVKRGLLRLRGAGQTLIPDTEELFSEACKASGEFTLLIRFATKGHEQRGPARIISLSEGSQSRNLTLGQQGEGLILRIRTTATNLNGTNPEVDLGDLEEEEMTTVVLTFSEANGLKGYRDGEKLEFGSVRGTLENWEPMGLILGNVFEDRRSWRGVVHSFELHSKAMDAARALQKSTID